MGGDPAAAAAASVSSGEGVARSSTAVTARAGDPPAAAASTGTWRTGWRQQLSGRCPADRRRSCGPTGAPARTAAAVRRGARVRWRHDGGWVCPGASTGGDDGYRKRFLLPRHSSIVRPGRSTGRSDAIRGGCGGVEVLACGRIEVLGRLAGGSVLVGSLGLGGALESACGLREPQGHRSRGAPGGHGGAGSRWSSVADGGGGQPPGVRGGSYRSRRIPWGTEGGGEPPAFVADGGCRGPEPAGESYRSRRAPRGVEGNGEPPEFMADGRCREPPEPAGGSHQSHGTPRDTKAARTSRAGAAGPRGARRLRRAAGVRGRRKGGEPAEFGGVRTRRAAAAGTPP